MGVGTTVYSGYLLWHEVSVCCRIYAAIISTGKASSIEPHLVVAGVMLALSSLLLFVVYKDRALSG